MDIASLQRIGVLAVAAILEVGGDAIIRAGLRGRSFPLGVLGFIVVGGYGVAVNLTRIDFTRMLGAYAGVFAATSVLFGVFVVGERVSNTTWLGTGVVLLGTLIIQVGHD